MSERKKYRTDPDVVRAKGHLGALMSRPTDPARIAEARAALAEARDSAFIRDLLDGRYLTEQGLTKLAALLNPDDQQAAT